jgi:hypothetical protein
LLTVLNYQKVVDLTAGEEAQDKANDLPPLPKMNTCKGVGSYHLDFPIEKKRKMKGGKQGMRRSRVSKK